MSTVFDVARYILDKYGPMSAMKLQKLAYYSQAWSTVWEDKALFPEEIQAWRNGPVVKDLYEAHKGQFHVTPSMIKGDPSTLDDASKETIDAVLSHYGHMSADDLSQLTHQESPWKDSWGDRSPDAIGGVVITLDKMSEYYSSIISE